MSGSNRRGFFTAWNIRFVLNGSECGDDFHRGVFTLHFLGGAVDAQWLAVVLKPTRLRARATKESPDYQSSSALPGKCTQRTSRLQGF